MDSLATSHSSGRALVCLQHHSTTIQHPTWGGIPDVVIAIVPKFTIENRLPIGLQFRLNAQIVAAGSSSSSASSLLPATSPTAATTASPIPVAEHVVCLPSAAGAVELCSKLREMVDEARYGRIPADEGSAEVHHATTRICAAYY